MVFKLASTLFAALAILSSVEAAPAAEKRQDAPSSFYLVSTTSYSSTPKSADLPNVSLLTLFDPYYQTDYVLRTTDPGYGSAPQFSLGDGKLETMAAGPHNIPSSQLYIAYSGQADTELSFSPDASGAAGSQGDLSLRGGYLLDSASFANAWFVCDGELEEKVIKFMPAANETSCISTYIHAVVDVPY